MCIRPSEITLRATKEDLHVGRKYVTIGERLIIDVRTKANELLKLEASLESDFVSRAKKKWVERLRRAAEEKETVSSRVCADAYLGSPPAVPARNSLR